MTSARRPVQQGSTATLAPDIDLIRPVQASELHQRPASTSVQLVHTGEIILPFVRVCSPTLVLLPCDRVDPALKHASSDLAAMELHARPVPHRTRPQHIALHAHQATSADSR